MTSNRPGQLSRVDPSFQTVARAKPERPEDDAASGVVVRFAPSPTGSLHLGSALTAVANRRYADEHDGELVLRIDDTNVADASEPESAIVEDLAWLGIEVDTGPIRQSGRLERH